MPKPAKPAGRRRAIERSATAAPSSTVFSSNLGWILVAWQGDQLTRISFGHSSPAEAAKSAECEPIESAKVPKWIAGLIAKIKKFAAGEKVDWGELPLAQERQTEFQRKVQEACRKIPRGEVWSYGELAAAAGAPGAARAVGSVMRTNRFPLIVPCHRVVAAGGKLGGFSCPAGVEMKLKLLAAEGVEFQGLGTRG
jgi:methylated-DNA-[protein]-cysteine S-methyltransferase